MSESKTRDRDTRDLRERIERQVSRLASESASVAPVEPSLRVEELRRACRSALRQLDARSDREAVLARRDPVSPETDALLAGLRVRFRARTARGDRA